MDYAFRIRSIIKFLYNTLFGPRRYVQLLEIIAILKPKRIMEIGTGDATHALAMINEARKHNKNIEYYGFDLFEALDNKTLEKEFSTKPPAMDNVASVLRKTGAKINLYKGDTKELLPRIMLPKMDLIFIDGGHSLGTIENDWNHAKKLMSEGTVVIFDDYWNRDDGGCRPIVDRIDRKKFRVELLPVTDKFFGGFRILRVRFAKVQKKSAHRQT